MLKYAKRNYETKNLSKLACHGDDDDNDEMVT